MNKKTAIVTGGTANDVPAMACLVMNIKDTNPNLADEFVIFHDGISEKDQKLIENIFPTRFILYQSPFHDVKNFGNVVTTFFSLMVFCKYECFKLLDEYDCVIWTDYDVVVVGDISELKESTATGIKMVYAAPVIENFYKEFIELEVLQQYDFTAQGVSTPIFSIQRNIFCYNKIYKWCIEKTSKLAKCLYLPEQAIVNLMLQEFNIKPDGLSHYAYSTHPSKSTTMEGIKILHAYGRPKFWDGIYNKTWEANYKKWLTMGGTHYECRTFKYKFQSMLQHTKTLIKRFIKAILPYGIVHLIQKRKK